MIFALFILACTPPPTAEQVAERVLANDLSGAAELASRSEDLGEWPGVLAAWGQLAEERRVLREAEHKIAMEEARTAVAASSWGEAMDAIRMGMQASPGDPELETLAARIEEVAVQRVEAGNLGGAAAIYEGLSITWAAKPQLAAAHLERARDLSIRAALSERYSAENKEQTLNSQRGILPLMATAAIETVNAEFVKEPDLAAMVQRSRDRVVLLAADKKAQAAFPMLASGKLKRWVEALPAPGSLELTEVIGQINELSEKTQKLGGVPAETVTYEIADAAIGGLDPWTRVIFPAEVASWEAHHAGVYYGVGLQLAVDSVQNVLVEFPIPGSPADEAGIHQGDQIESVGGETHTDHGGDTRKVAFEQALLGDDGTEIDVRVNRSGDQKDFKIKRAPIYPDVVTGWQRQDDNSWSWWLDEDLGVAYVRIVAFKAHTDEALDEALSELEGLSAVVVDLRSNPGGDVNAAVNVVDRFVTEGTLARLEGRVEVETGPDIDPETGEKLAAWNAGIPGHALEGLAVAVLVDDQTASSAEIVAGGLQELAHADVIGTRTYGKGLSQVLRTDPERGYALQFTNLYWALPSGRVLDRSLAESPGVEPAITDLLTPAERFSVAIAERQRQYARSHADGTPIAYASTVGRADLPPLSRDPHVERALLVLRARMSEGLE